MRFVNADDIRLDVRRSLEREIIEADFALLTEPEDSKMGEAAERLRLLKRRLELLDAPEDERRAEIEEKLKPRRFWQK